MVSLRVQCCFGAVNRLFFTSKSDRAAFFSAPSMDFVKQTELASLSLSQCLTPWPSSTFNP